MILLVVYACFPGDSEGNKSAQNAGVKVKSLSRVRLFATPWTVTYQATRTMSKNAGLGCHFLLRGIFLTQGSNPVLLYCKKILYYVKHQRSPNFTRNVQNSFNNGLIVLQFHQQFIRDLVFSHALHHLV